MTPTIHTPDPAPDTPERETLCALFDGELQGDAARFAHRRLAHDVEWRAAFGRWQLAADVLRGDAAGFAPAGFADRIAHALDAEREAALPLAVGETVSSPRLRQRRRWIPGAALAASVAVAALFVARPLSNPDQPSGFDASPQLAQRDASTPDPAQAGAPIEIPGPAGEIPPEAGVAAAVAAAVVTTPRRSTEQRQALRPPVRSASSARPTIEAPATTVDNTALAAAEPPGSPDPFKPQSQHADVDVTQSRPWPRAVLPGYGARNGYSVGYGASAAPSPTFYPFEPKFPDSTDVPSGSEPSSEVVPAPGSRPPTD